MTPEMTTVELLLAVLAVLQIADIVLTKKILDKGGKELNPFLNKIMQEVGVLPALLLVKGIMFAVIAWVFMFNPTPVIILVLINILYGFVVANNWVEFNKK